jgi:hypothetical protein
MLAVFDHQRHPGRPALRLAHDQRPVMEGHNASTCQRPIAVALPSPRLPANCCRTGAPIAPPRSRCRVDIRQGALSAPGNVQRAPQHHHVGKTLDALVEALMPIVFGPPISRVWPSRLIRLPKRQGSIGAGRGLWKDEIFPIATAFFNSPSADRTPTG